MALAAPVAPIDVVHVDPADPAMPVELPADHLLVTNTSCLPWQPGRVHNGRQFVKLGQGEMALAFAPRNRTSRLPADLPAAKEVTPLRFGLEADAWKRTLNMYIVKHGLAANPIPDRKILAADLFSFQLDSSDRDALVIRAGDWLSDVESTAFRAYAPAITGGRGNRRAAIPQRPGLTPDVAFLDKVNILAFEDVADDDVAPWKHFAFLVAGLGPCLVQDARLAENSVLRSIAGPLAAGCRKYAGLDTDATSFQLAHETPEYVKLLASALPTILIAAAALASSTFHRDLRDAIKYLLSADGRRIVEMQRVHLFGNTCVPRPATPTHAARRPWPMKSSIAPAPWPPPAPGILKREPSGHEPHGEGGGRGTTDAEDDNPLRTTSLELGRAARSPCRTGRMSRLDYPCHTGYPSHPVTMPPGRLRREPRARARRHTTSLST